MIALLLLHVPPIVPYTNQCKKLLLFGHLENIPTSINMPFQIAIILPAAGPVVPRRTTVNGQFLGRFSGSSDNFRQALSMAVSLLSLVLSLPAGVPSSYPSGSRQPGDHSSFDGSALSAHQVMISSFYVFRCNNCSFGGQASSRQHLIASQLRLRTPASSLRSIRSPELSTCEDEDRWNGEDPLKKEGKGGRRGLAQEDPDRVDGGGKLL